MFTILPCKYAQEIFLDHSEAENTIVNSWSQVDLELNHYLLTVQSKANYLPSSNPDILCKMGTKWAQAGSEDLCCRLELLVNIQEISLLLYFLV